MRLNNAIQKAIEEVSLEVLNEFLNWQVWLFGSRIEVNKKGGDIDLCIEVSSPLKDQSALKSKFYAKLVQRIGEQKIDIIVVISGAPTPEQTALLSKGKVLICQKQVLPIKNF